MIDNGRQAHWENVYRSKDETEVSWFEPRSALSLELIHGAGISKNSALVDIGGGASRLADTLLEEGFADVTVLDLSTSALDTAKARIGPRSAQVQWIVADVTRWQPPRKYDLWHDRAVFHFLTRAEERAAYAERVIQALRSGGQLIIATFALGGPERCSGLPVVCQMQPRSARCLGQLFA